MSITVTTFNLWNRQGPWEQRRALIKQELKRLNSDLVGLQEVVRMDDGVEQADLFATGYDTFTARHRDGFLGNAILSRWPIRDTFQWTLPNGASDEHRVLACALIESPFGLIPFFNTHLNWRLDDGQVREAQLLFVANRIAETIRACGPAFPPILVGDLNAEPDSDEIRFLGGKKSLADARVYFADAFALVGSGDGATYSRRNKFAAAIREPNRRIDYIFAKGPDENGRGEPLVAELCFDQEVDGVFPSDHFGVTATLSVT